MLVLEELGTTWTEGVDGWVQKGGVWRGRDGGGGGSSYLRSLSKTGPLIYSLDTRVREHALFFIPTLTSPASLFQACSSWCCENVEKKMASQEL